MALAWPLWKSEVTSMIHGELFRILVADTDKAAEGIEFLGVREHHLVDVPTSFPDWKQRIGRSVRSFGHANLTPPEQDRVN